ncbi:hypothetical protein LTR70_003372 [Exophiala xenobiotica]|uniref:Aminoglycoside phosphotransferase domain-containing protein n=1 Tax=Lithohypha guttulata TaxID=1690604 RepID=A0ABR0KHY6_9EURO|nr:hypothetical protein LTR24_002920 [Lithohypha guttulata]KAK5323510.1 hypothetical protein LTR70_003372 [Exophiala xenobiotica]
MTSPPVPLMEPQRVFQPGLIWMKSPVSPALVEPDTEAIKSTVAETMSDVGKEHINVTFLAEGALNKVYLVYDKKNDKQYVMRVSLPVDPYHKTYAEVSTLKYLRSKTILPVPEVYAYNTSPSNTIGFEWILMSFVPGVTLQSCWFRLTMDEKRDILSQIVAFQADLFAHPFHGIGGLIIDDIGSLVVDRASEDRLWWYNRLHDPCHKGPFSSAQEYLTSKVLHMRNETQRDYEREMAIRISRQQRTQLDPTAQTLLPSVNDGENAQQDNDEEDEPHSIPILRNLQRILTRFPELFRGVLPLTNNTSAQEISILTHADLSANNILIDPNTKKITGIIDWENVLALPLSLACDLPKLLEPNTKPRHEAPDPDKYGDYTPGFGKEYHEFQVTELRAYFLEEMHKVCPAWVQEYQKGKDLRDLAQVVALADDYWSANEVAEWLNYFEAGNKKTMAWIEWGRELEDEGIKQQAVGEQHPESRER